VKQDLLPGLSTTLAAYHLTKENFAFPDPNAGSDGCPITGAIPGSEARSQGIELDVVGSPLPGWDMILTYAYTDTEVTKETPELLAHSLLVLKPSALLRRAASERPRG
jgi:Outer membrane receptor for ferric coprogen and ferric-rhodotorulic acid